MKYDIKQGDCLELMKDIPDGSIDMILCDLPYGTMKGASLDGWTNQTTEWDEVINTEKLFAEYERILRMNGVAVLFSQEPYTSHLRTFESENFNFLYPMIWKKNHFANALLSNKAPVSYFEDLNVFAKKYDNQNLHPLRKYFFNVLQFVGGSSCKYVNSILGHRRAEHCFYIDSSQFKLCTEKTYQELIDNLHIDKMDGFKTFEELKQIDMKYQRTFNLPSGSKFIGNVLDFKKDHQGLHPTQKPVALLEYLIKIYTNEGNTVLDNCMGSGSTGVACIHTNRNFIGMELDEKYFNISKDRMESEFNNIPYVKNDVHTNTKNEKVNLF